MCFREDSSLNPSVWKISVCSHLSLWIHKSNHCRYEYLYSSKLVLPSLVPEIFLLINILILHFSKVSFLLARFLMRKWKISIKTRETESTLMREMEKSLRGPFGEKVWVIQLSDSAVWSTWHPRSRFMLLKAQGELHVRRKAALTTKSTQDLISFPPAIWQVRPQSTAGLLRT